MSDLFQFVLVWVGLLCSITWLCFGFDKWLAKQHRRRIPEAHLLLLCLIGGAGGGLVGMYLFHHKTRKPKFYITIPLLLVANLVILGMVFRFS